MIIDADDKLEWPYPLKYDSEKEYKCDILVLGGGVAGCWAAISAKAKGADVILVEKGANPFIAESSAAGTGSLQLQIRVLASRLKNSRLRWLMTTMGITMEFRIILSVERSTIDY